MADTPLPTPVAFDPEKAAKLLETLAERATNSAKARRQEAASGVFLRERQEISIAAAERAEADASTLRVLATQVREHAADAKDAERWRALGPKVIAIRALLPYNAGSSLYAERADDSDDMTRLLAEIADRHIAANADIDEWYRNNPDAPRYGDKSMSEPRQVKPHTPGPGYLCTDCEQPHIPGCENRFAKGVRCPNAPKWPSAEPCGPCPTPDKCRGHGCPLGNAQIARPSKEPK